MSTANAPAARARWRRPVRALLALALIAGAVWQARVHLGAWDELKQGRAALDRDDPADARRHLARCLDVWPQSGDANYFAAQAAGRSGDPDAAREHLKRAARNGRPAADVEVETALLDFQSGSPGAEPVLLRHLDAEHPESPRILAALVPVYLAQYRLTEAGPLGDRWVQLTPASARAWKAQAETLERLRKIEPATDALRRVVELDPDDRKARASLVRMILETRQQPDEAARHAEWLAQTDPRDAAAQFQLAACRDAQGRTADAVAILDRLIAAGSADPKVHHLRGRIALARDPAAALPRLRRAAQLDASDPDVLYSLVLCLKQVGTPAEAAEAEQRWRQCTADLARVRDLGRAITAAPHDPELRREMGELFLRNGRDAEGLRWLESALRENPGHVATHRALAAYFDRTGQPLRAAHHRLFVTPAPNGTARP